MAQFNIAVPLVFGAVLASHLREVALDIPMLVAALAFGVFDQLFIVFANDVADEEGDRENETFNLFSGGSRVLPEGKLTRRALSVAALVMAACMLALSGGLALFADRPAMPAAWALAIVLLWSYSYPPLRLAYRGWGEAAQGLGVGVALPLIGWYLQAGDLVAVPWQALAPGFLLAFASNISTALPDHPADAKVDKLSWPVRYGQPRARKHSMQIIAVAVLLTPVVLEGMEQTDWLIVELLTLAALAPNLHFRRKANAENVEQCRRFVFFNGLAINAALVGWTATMLLS